MENKPFLEEEWMNQYEVGARYNIAETCVDSVSLDELFQLTGEDKEAFLSSLCARRLTYGDIFGQPAFLEGICRLYRDLRPEQVIPTHGAAGANHHLFCSLVEPGDKVISVLPTYQQLYSIPDSLGAKVELLPLSPDNGFLPDLARLEKLAQGGVKLICLNNPNNPTGALMSQEMLEEIVSIARRHGSYILCDEVYRHLTQEDGYCPSIVDLYEKGISVSSMSKVFSLAGIRLGWITSRDPEVLKRCLIHRDYDLISCGLLDETVAALARSTETGCWPATGASYGRICPFWTTGSGGSPMSPMSSPRLVPPPWCTTTWTSPPMTSARRCITPPGPSSPRATASNRSAASGWATPATGRPWWTAWRP